MLSHFLTPLLKGKSVNTSAFLLAALTHLKLCRPLPKKKRVHELLDPGPFLDQVSKLMSSTGNVKTVRKTTKKATARKAPSKKAAVKKRAIARKKSTRKASPARG